MASRGCPRAVMLSMGTAVPRRYVGGEDSILGAAAMDQAAPTFQPPRSCPQESPRVLSSHRRKLRPASAGRGVSDSEREQEQAFGPPGRRPPAWPPDQGACEAVPERDRVESVFSSASHAGAAHSGTSPLEPRARSFESGCVASSSLFLCLLPPWAMAASSSHWLSLVCLPNPRL